MEKPEFKSNKEWYKFLDKLEADNSNNRLNWFNRYSLNTSDNTLRIILNPRFIIRYEPGWFENSVIFDSESSNITNVNKSAFEIIKDISVNSPSFIELFSKFNTLSQETLKEFLNQLLDKNIIKIVNEITARKYVKFLKKYPTKANKSNLKNHFEVPYPSAPYTVTIYPTYFCNFSCLHCGVVPPKKNVFLTFEQWRTIIDELIDNKIIELKIMGGEPLTYPYITNMIEYLRNIPLRIKLCTNGYLLTNNFLEKIFTSKNIDLLLSLDGGTDKIHDNMRNFPGAFDKIICILNKAKEFNASKKIILTSVISKVNEKEFKKIINLAYKFDVKHLAFIFTYHAGKCKNNKNYTNYFINKKLPMEIITYSKKYLDEVSISVQGMGPNEDNLKKRVSKFFEHKIICNAGNVSCMIDSLGNLYPCDILSTIPPTIRKKYIIGNVLNEGFLTLWHSKSFSLFRGGYKRENLRYCNDCKYNEFCGQKKCRFYALSSTDDFDGKAYECNFLKL